VGWDALEEIVGADALGMGAAEIALGGDCVPKTGAGMSFCADTSLLFATGFACAFDSGEMMGFGAGTGGGGGVTETSGVFSGAADFELDMRMLTTWSLRTIAKP